MAGPRLKGSIEPGGGDWATSRTGYAVDLDARYLIRADDGALIDIVNKGFWVATPEVDAALDAGESVDPSAYYFRTQPVFRTDAPPAHLADPHGLRRGGIRRQPVEPDQDPVLRGSLIRSVNGSPSVRALTPSVNQIVGHS